jgi:hypothetical protein
VKCSCSLRPIFFISCACMFFVLAWCIFQRKVQNERNKLNKSIFVSEKSGCNDTNADLHMEEKTTRFNLCDNRPYVHILFSSYKFP